MHKQKNFKKYVVTLIAVCFTLILFVILHNIFFRISLEMFIANISQLSPKTTAISLYTYYTSFYSSIVGMFIGVYFYNIVKIIRFFEKQINKVLLIFKHKNSNHK